MFVAEGRESELDQVIAGIGLAVAGQPEVMLVRGSAGMGKTWLVHEACRRAAIEWERLAVIWGQCTSIRGPQTPYQPFDEAIHRLLPAGAWQAGSPAGHLRDQPQAAAGPTRVGRRSRLPMMTGIPIIRGESPGSSRRSRCTQKARSWWCSTTSTGQTMPAWRPFSVSCGRSRVGICRWRSSAPIGRPCRGEPVDATGERPIATVAREIVRRYPAATIDLASATDPERSAAFVDAMLVQRGVRLQPADRRH